EGSRPSVIAQIERVGSCIEIVAHLINLVRPGVSQLKREPAAVLHSDARLQRVVGEIRAVGLLGDRAEPREDSVEVGVKCGTILARIIWIRELARNSLPIVIRISGTAGIIRSQRECIARYVHNLVPASGTNVL